MKKRKPEMSDLRSFATHIDRNYIMFFIKNQAVNSTLLVSLCIECIVPHSRRFGQVFSMISMLPVRISTYCREWTRGTPVVYSSMVKMFL